MVHAYCHRTLCSLSVSLLCLTTAAGPQSVAAAMNDGPQTSEVVLASKYLEYKPSEPNQGAVNVADEIKTEDLVLDLDTSHVALQVVSLPVRSESKQSSPSQRIRVLVPFLTAKTEVPLFARLGNRIAETQLPTMTRELVRGIYKGFEREVYWVQYQSKLDEARKTQFDAEPGTLMSFRELCKQESVVDRNNQQIGRIVDVGIRPATAEVVYVVLESTNRTRRAIPLGAFVERKQDRSWKIELDSAEILKFAPMSDKHVPEKIDRGWEEYVAVRYGRPDVQTTEKENREDHK